MTAHKTTSIIKACKNYSNKLLFIITSFDGENHCQTKYLIVRCDLLQSSIKAIIKRQNILDVSSKPVFKARRKSHLPNEM